MPSHKNLPFQPPKPPRLEVISAAASPVLVTQKSLTPLSSVSSQTSPQSGSCSSWKPAAQLASGQNSESPQLPQLLPAAGLSSVCTGGGVRGWVSVCICIFTRCYPGIVRGSLNRIVPRSLLAQFRPPPELTNTAFGHPPPLTSIACELPGTY